MLRMRRIEPPEGDFLLAQAWSAFFVPEPQAIFLTPSSGMDPNRPSSRTCHEA